MYGPTLEGTLYLENQVKLEVNNVSLRFGGVDALSNVSFKVREQELFAIVGPNGAGKTSLLNCISGFYRPASGNIYFEGKEITRMPIYKMPQLGIARTFQNIVLFHEMTTLENLLVARHTHFRSGFLPGAIYFGRGQREEARHREAAEEVIRRLNLQSVRNRIVGTLPYGLRKRVELETQGAAYSFSICLNEKQI